MISIYYWSERMITKGMILLARHVITARSVLLIASDVIECRDSQEATQRLPFSAKVSRVGDGVFCHDLFVAFLGEMLELASRCWEVLGQLPGRDGRCFDEHGVLMASSVVQSSRQSQLVRIERSDLLLKPLLKLLRTLRKPVDPRFHPLDLLL